MEFKDKNGVNINVGDIVRPDEGRDCLILSIAHNTDINEVVMYGQQLLDSAAFAVLTKKQLSEIFTKVISQ